MTATAHLERTQWAGSWIGTATVRSVAPGGIALVETSDGRYVQVTPANPLSVGTRVLIATGPEGAWALRDLGPSAVAASRAREADACGPQRAVPKSDLGRGATGVEGASAPWDRAPAAMPALRSPDGTTAAVEGDALIVRDASGRILFERGRAGATVHVHEDLRLAVDGKLCLSGADGVELESASERIALGAQGTSVESRALVATTGDATLRTARAHLVAGVLETVAESARGTYGRVEVKAARILERAHETYREATGAAHHRAGRMRVIADGAYQLFAGRARLKTDEELALDGEQIRLG